MNKIKIKRLNDAAVIPFYATKGAAGMDLSAYLKDEISLKPLERALVPTGLSIELPNDSMVALIYARSSLALKEGLTLPNCVGVIDSDYRGEVKVAVINLGERNVIIKNGDRIAQMVITPIIKAEIELVTELSETQRGEGGFGSTGKT